MLDQFGSVKSDGFELYTLLVCSVHVPPVLGSSLAWATASFSACPDTVAAGKLRSNAYALSWSNRSPSLSLRVGVVWFPCARRRPKAACWRAPAPRGELAAAAPGAAAAAPITSDTARTRGVFKIDISPPR